MAKNKKKCDIPKYELEALAEVLYPTLKEFYESKGGQAQFKAWQERQSNLQKNKCGDG